MPAIPLFIMYVGWAAVLYASRSGPTLFRSRQRPTLVPLVVVATLVASSTVVWSYRYGVRVSLDTRSQCMISGVAEATIPTWDGMGFSFLFYYGAHCSKSRIITPGSLQMTKKRSMLTFDILRTVAGFTGWRTPMWGVCSAWNIALRSEYCIIELSRFCRILNIVMAIPNKDHLLILVKPAHVLWTHDADTETHIHACIYAILDTLQSNDDAARPTTLSLRWNSGHVGKPHIIVNQIASHLEQPGCRLQELDVDLRNKGSFDGLSKMRFVGGCISLTSLRSLHVAWDSDGNLQWLMDLLRFAWWGERWHRFGITLQENRSSHSTWWTGVLKQMNIELQLHYVSHPHFISKLQDLILHFVGVAPRLSVVFNILSFLTDLRTVSLSFSQCDITIGSVCDMWEPMERKIAKVRRVAVRCEAACLTTHTLVTMLEGFQRIGVHQSVQELVLCLERNELDRSLWNRLAVTLQQFTALRCCTLHVAGNSCGIPPSGVLPSTVCVLGASESRMRFGAPLQMALAMDDNDDATVWNE